MKVKYPRLTDRQFIDVMQPLNDTHTQYAACWECNEIICVDPSPKVRMTAIIDHDARNLRHLTFVEALNIDPKEEM